MFFEFLEGTLGWGWLVFFHVVALALLAPVYLVLAVRAFYFVRDPIVNPIQKLYRDISGDQTGRSS